MMKEDFNVGDEVICSGVRGYITRITDRAYNLISYDGAMELLGKVPYIEQHMRKTGRHSAQLVKVLKQLKEEESE